MQILLEIFQKVRTTHVPAFLANLCHSTHRPERRQTRCFGRKASRQFFFNLLIQMEAQLFCEFPFDSAAGKDRTDSQPEHVTKALSYHRKSPKRAG